jgi:hypothetical protein
MVQTKIADHAEGHATIQPCLRDQAKGEITRAQLKKRSGVEPQLRGGNELEQLAAH